MVGADNALPVRAGGKRVAFALEVSFEQQSD
jgi:hypothetical protein